MRTICFYFQIHQPFRFRRYRFFDMGVNHYYYDDYSNESILKRHEAKSYLATNKILLDVIKEYGTRFKVAFSISGTALDQMELYAPELLESFQKLAKTGCVEFLGETYSHSLASLKNRDEFEMQVKAHSDKIQQLFGKRPTAFRNTELIYNDEIGSWVADMGFKIALTEGAKHILGWKSPNFVYCNAINPKLKLLLRNYKLSDDIALLFSNKGWSEYPLTTEKFVGWLKNLDAKEEVVNLFMSYETFGTFHGADSGIFDFLRALPKAVFTHSKLTFSTPSEIADNLQPIAPMNFMHPVSWRDEARDVSVWLGNELQLEASNKLYALRDKAMNCGDPVLQKDWQYLQVSDHFFYMSTKFFTDGMHSSFNPYNSPYDAFINYMNILSDFELRVNQCIGSKVVEEKKIAPIMQQKTEAAPKKPAAKTKAAPAKKAAAPAKKAPAKAPAAPKKKETKPVKKTIAKTKKK